MGKQTARKVVGSPAILGTTKGKILVLLCRRRYTVAELAAELGVTGNAIRAQLKRFQRDSLVLKAGSRHGVRRPHVEYELTAKARHLFPRAYEPVLQNLVDVLMKRLSRSKSHELLLEAGRRLFDQHLGPLRAKGPLPRLTEVMDKLNGSSLGIEVTEKSGKTTIRSCSCPLATVTAEHPEMCGVLADVIGGVLDADVREQCEKGD